MGKSIIDWAKDAWDSYKKYKDVIDPVAKTVGSLGKAYIDYKSQKELNELTEEAYNQYMREKEAAGQEAQAAVDLNLTPMQISNVPTTKADVSDFTLVAARGGLMNLPTRQRKRYAFGPGPALEGADISTIEEMDTPFDPREEGVNISDMVFHDTGDDRTNAQQVWQSGQIDQGLYQMDFEIFFKSGDWEDHISRGSVQGDMKMASLERSINPKILAEWEADGGASGPYKTPEEYYEAYYGDMEMLARGGIIGLRHGGRPGYANSNIEEFVTADTEGVVSKIPSQQDEGTEGWGDADLMGTSDYFVPPLKNEPTSLEEVIEIAKRVPVPGNPFFIWDTMKKMGVGFSEAIEIVKNKFGGEEVIEESEGIERFKKGGRIKKAPGGIMNLGGLEKDYRTTGGFVPIGAYEKKDDVPARLSKNEFVMTADAVRAAGGGSINKGAQLMYDTMKHLEAQPQARRMTA